MQSDPWYGATPPYEVAIVYTLRYQRPGDGFECVAYHVAGSLYEWRKREQ